MTPRRLLCLALLLTWLPSVAALAHEIRPGYLQITQVAPERYDVVWKEPLGTEGRLPVEVALPAGCESARRALPERTGGALVQRWEAACDLTSGRVGMRGLAATLTDVLVRITYTDGGTVSEILRPSRPSVDLAHTTPGAGAYFLLGIEHLLTGVDHILFVIGLVLFIRQPWMLAKTVTAFTAAHSITLALSVLNLVKLPQGPVEAVIALSILFLARELMVPETQRSRITLAAPWVMAFGFGLLHGFGFAGALTDIGLPRNQLAWSLVTFNLGIEAGQLAVIAAALIAGWLAHRAVAVAAQAVRPEATPALMLEQAFVLAMGCTAGFWTVDRVLALV